MKIQANDISLTAHATTESLLDVVGALLELPSHFVAALLGGFAVFLRTGLVIATRTRRTTLATSILQPVFALRAADEVGPTCVRTAEATRLQHGSPLSQRRVNREK